MKQHALMLGLVIAVSVHAYDELVLAIAMPAITFELDGVQWYGLAFAAYLLTTLVGVVWAGQDIDKRGPLRVFLLGYGAFAVGLILAGFAHNMLMLVIGRALQGLGGGISWTVAFAAINLAFQPASRPKMIAILDIAWVVPSLLAPIIGGYFVDFLGWRWIFFSQLPILLLAALLLYPHLVTLNKETSVIPSGRIRLAIALAATCSLVLLAFNQPLSWIWLLLLPGTWAAIQILKRLMPPGFGNSNNLLSAALLTHGAVFICFYGYEIFLPLGTTELFEMTARETGFLIGFGACVWCIASFVQARLSRSVQAYISLRVGFGLFIGGTVIMLVGTHMYINHSADQYTWLYVPMALCSFGTGMAFNVCVSSAMSLTQTGNEGATSTALGIISSLSVGLISGIGGAIINFGERHQSDMVDTLLSIWIVGLVVAILVLVALVPKLRHHALKPV